MAEKEAVKESGGAISFIDDTRKVLSKQKKFRIMIPSTERDKDAVTVGINGYTYNIPRDKEVEVPEGVIEILKNASVMTYEVRKRENGEGNEMVGKEVQRFPFQSVMN